MKISILSRLLDFVAPRFCPICGSRLSAAETGICGVCDLRLPRTYFWNTPTDNLVARLFWGLAPIERASSLFYYTRKTGVSLAIYDLKYHSRPQMGICLGRLAGHDMLPSGFFSGIDLLVPVPLARKRFKARGYNQSEMIAVGIREMTGIPICTGLLRRSTFTQSQTKLDRRGRMANVDGLFQLADREAAVGKHILLIDDVITTGATLMACATALKEVRDVKISVLALGFAHS